MTRLPGNIMESIRVKAAKAFSKGQFAKNCLMLAEKIEIVPLTNVNETDVNIVGKKFEINRVNYEYRNRAATVNFSQPRTPV